MSSSFGDISSSFCGIPFPPASVSLSTPEELANGVVNNFHRNKPFKLNDPTCDVGIERDLSGVFRVLAMFEENEDLHSFFEEFLFSLVMEHKTFEVVTCEPVTYLDKPASCKETVYNKIFFIFKFVNGFLIGE